MKKLPPLRHLSCSPRLNQRGNAILFTLLALVIGGIVIAVGVTQYQDAERAVRIQSTVSEVNTIIGLAKQNYGQYRYKNLTTTVAVGSRIIPADLHKDAATAANKFSGAITLNAVTGDKGQATLTYDEVPIDLCTAIVNGTQAIADVIKAGTNEIKPSGAPVDIGKLNTACGTAAGAKVKLEWTFGRT